MSTNKPEALKNLILVGAAVVKADAHDLFLLGLVLLGLQTFEIKSMQPGKQVMAEIMLSAAIAVVALSQVVMASSFKTPQIFLLIVLLGAVLVAVESVRKYSEL